jgi:alpha-L-rhamnosidase/Glycosyl hydrolases family 2, sugar binding domain
VVIKNNAAKILYRHRQTVEQDIYWLDNRSDAENSAEVSFNITGKMPELWNAQTGKTEKIGYKIKDGRTIISLHFDSWEAYFIVFKEKTTVLTYQKPMIQTAIVTEIRSNWTINFPKIGNIKTDKLNSWTTLADIQNPNSDIQNTEGSVKYFSGTATYQNTFKINQLDTKARYEIDLGDVKNIAEVIVNSKNMGIAWKKPFKLDITEGVKKGDNSIEIKVTNLWVNRLIGDAQPDVKVKTTFTTMPFYQADAPLLPSGLMGPVVILSRQ